MAVRTGISIRRSTLLSGAAAAALLASACGSTSSSSPAASTSTPAAESPSASAAATAPPGVATVALNLRTVDFAFSPTALQVTPNSMVTITLVNAGQVKHNFTADAVKANVDMDVGKTTTASFMAPASGVIAFHCEYHPGKMVGTITVAAAAAAAVPATPAPTPTPMMHHSMAPTSGY